MGNNESSCNNQTNETTISIPKYLNFPSISDSKTQSSQFTPITSTGNTPITPFTPPILIPLTPFPSRQINKPSQIIISDRFAELAANFWRTTIESCSMEHRLEISCSIWFGMMAASIDLHKLIKCKFKNNDDLEMTALRNLDMIGFIIRTIYASNTDLESLLSKLGNVHKNMGIKSEYYALMFDQLNQTLKYYFQNKYSEQIEFALSEIFAYITQMMSDYDIKIPKQCENISFLQSLRYCIRNKIGKEYLYRHLNNVYCEEMVMFLHLLSVYKSTKQSEKRYLIAKDIAETCINSNGMFAVNISYESRQNVLLKINSANEDIMNIDFFMDVEDEICRLIMQTHWKKFKNQTNELYINTVD